MLMAIGGAVVGFVAGVLFAMSFPLGLYWQKLLFRLSGPARLGIA
jgi:hypothetical protein